MGLIDSHVHLHFPDYDADRELVIRRARESGIDAFINIGTDALSSQKSLDLANQYNFVWASAGIHPHDAKHCDQASLRAIEEILKHPRAVAIGEVGLDFFRDHSPVESQKDVFRQFLRLHKKIKKPLVLHCREAYVELISLLREELSPPYDGIIHCFSADREMMEELLDLGFYISFAGPLTYKKNDVLREACRACPLDRLILETDAPFLPPQSMRGKRNETSFLVETARLAADLHVLPFAEFSDKIAENTRSVFRL